VEEQIVGQVKGRLAVVEKEMAFFVVRKDDLDDWLVRFEKSQDFKAREWAENMVRVYNRRLEHRSAGLLYPAGVQPARYQPDPEDQ
jgi:hypothetical protein